MNTSLYIHIPYCVSKCDYCDFFSIGCGKRQVPDEYVSALCNEILWKISTGKIEKWNTVFIGGGTPSLLSENQLTKIFSAIQSVSEKEISECTIETNPDDITEDFLNMLKKMPVSRISCGIQSLQEKVLKDVHRRSSQSAVLKALELISNKWDRDFSVDIISGLPEQSEKTFIEGLNQLINFKPDHISMYSLTIEENTPLFSRMEKNQTEYDYDKADRMWLKGRDFLESKGYFQYEVSNFALRDKQCLHNLVYWKLQDYEGCGAGATGTFYENNRRTTNLPDLEKYIKYWNDKEKKFYFENAPVEIETLDKETQKFEFLMMGLRTLEGISSAEYEKRFHENIPEEIIRRFNDWQKKNLAVIRKSENETFYSLSKKGILFLNKFLTE